MDKQYTNNKILLREYVDLCPHLIAVKINEYNQAESCAMKFDLMEKIYTHFLRYIGCICLSEYLIDQESNVQINMSINGLIRPSIGDWLNFINTYLKYVTKMGKETFISELPVVFNTLAKQKVDVLIDVSNIDEFEKKSIIESIMLFRNKLRHGSFSPNEEMYSAYIDVYGDYLEDILDSFRDVFTKYKLVTLKDEDLSSYVFSIIHGVKICKEIEIDKEDLEVNFDLEVNELYLLGDEKILPLSNLLNYYLIMEDVLSEDEPIVIYDGLNKFNAKYVGSQKSYAIEKLIDKLRSKFTSKKIPLKFGKKTLDLDNIRDYVNDLSKVSVDLHEKTKKFCPNSYVSRVEDIIINRFLESDKNGIVITAEAGSGKTNLMCNITRNRIELGDIVYLISGGNLNRDSGVLPIYSEFKEELLNGNDFDSLMEFFEAINKKIDSDNKFILLIDAVNESHVAREVLSEIDKIISNSENYKWLKVIVTIRSEFYKRVKHYIEERQGKKFNFFTDESRYYIDDINGKREMELKSWTLLQRKKAFDKHCALKNINDKSFFELPQSIWNLLAVPINMKIYFTSIDSNCLNGNNIINRVSLFNTYHMHLVNEMSKSTCELLDYIVDKMYESKKNTIEMSVIDDYNEMLIKREKIIDSINVLTPYERLLDLGIIQSRLVGNWYESRFVYQAFFEYLLYLRLVKDKCSLDELAKVFINSIRWDELTEMHEAIKLYALELQDDTISFIYMVLDLTDESSIILVKSSIIDLIINKLINAKSEVEVTKVINNSLKCLSNYGCHEWMIDVGTKLFSLNMHKETRILYSIILESKYELEGNNKFLVYNTLGTINREYFGNVEDIIDYFIKASEYANESEKIMLKSNIAKAYRVNGMLGKAEEVLDMALKESNIKSHMIPYLNLITQRHLCHRARNEYAESLRLSKLNYEKRNYINNPMIRLNLKAEYANELQYSGFIEQSITLSHEVLNEAAELGELNLLVDTMNALARRYVIIHEYEKAIELAKEGLTLWKQSGFYRGQMVMCIHIINASHGLGKSRESVESYFVEAEYLSNIIKEQTILEMYNEALSKWQFN